jgi:3-oxoacyl-[acyl-carrier-protein] synthase II
MTRPVVITGVGVVHAAVTGGTSALATYLAAPARPAGPAPDVAARLADGEARRLSRVCQLAVVAARLALRDGSYDTASELGLVVGTELGDLASTIDFADGFLRRGPSGLSALLFPNTVMNTMAAATAIAVGARGMALTLNAIGVAGELAVARAVRAVAGGEVDAALAGGVDELDARVGWALGQAGAVDEGRGEGATFVLLEAEASARRRGAPIQGRVLGAAWRALPARPHGIGRSCEPRAVRAALAAAGAVPADVGWVYCSASGDRGRDAWERRLLDAAFAPARPPATSLATTLGHHAGLGALRVAAAAWTARSGRLAAADDTGSTAARGRCGLVHALARGGTEVTLVVGAAA